MFVARFVVRKAYYTVEGVKEEANRYMRGEGGVDRQEKWKCVHSEGEMGLSFERKTYESAT